MDKKGNKGKSGSNGIASAGDVVTVQHMWGEDEKGELFVMPISNCKVEVVELNMQAGEKIYLGVLRNVDDIKAVLKVCPEAMDAVYFSEDQIVTNHTSFESAQETTSETKPTGKEHVCKVLSIELAREHKNRNGNLFTCDLVVSTYRTTV